MCVTPKLFPSFDSISLVRCFLWPAQLKGGTDTDCVYFYSNNSFLKKPFNAPKKNPQCFRIELNWIQMIQLKSEMYKVKQHTFCRMHLLSEKQSLLTGKRIVFPYTMTAIAVAAVLVVRCVTQYPTCV